MKQFLLALFIFSAGLMKSQCSLSTSVTPPSCPGNCDASITVNLSPGCTAFPYNLVINGGTCTPTGTFVMNSSSMTFSNLCGCTSPLPIFLYGSGPIPIPITFTTITLFGGIPVTTTQFINAPATCSACCTGSLTTITAGGTGPYTYTWTPPVSTTGTITSACPGVYTLCASDSKGCTTCNSYTIGFSTGIVENEGTPVKVMYSKDEILIMDAAQINMVTVYDLTGRVVYKIDNAGQKEFRLNKSLFSKGVYVMSVEGEHRLSKHKIIVE